MPGPLDTSMRALKLINWGCNCQPVTAGTTTPNMPSGKKMTLATIQIA